MALPTSSRNASLLLRRAPTLVGWWEGSVFRVANYSTQKTLTLNARAIAVLAELDEWRTLAELQALVGRRSLQRDVARLRRQGLLETTDDPRDPVEFALTTWGDWTPHAAFFHFMTKNGAYATREDARRAIALWETTDDLPASRKTLQGPRVELPPFRRHGAFPSVLLARRSWRRFGSAAVTLDQLSTLLGLTWGTQKWLHLGAAMLALKTSPSGGACHSLEAHVAVRRIRGLDSGVYHYDSDGHALVRLKQRWSRRWLARCLGGQDWLADADAVVFLTSVFPRVQWKYRSPRAYRTVLLEAGHFCQTFCLTATWLGLAPFCTEALADTLIEKSLQVDGVTESVLYAMGVGSRPPGTNWAPWPDRRNPPRTSEPAHQRRTRRRLEPPPQ